MVLSHTAKQILEEKLRSDLRTIPPILVVPTCTDLQKFVPAEKTNGVKPVRIVYVGSVGTWYLLREMAEFFKTLRRGIPEARWTIVTPRPDPLLTETLKTLDPDAYDVRMLTHEDVPEVLRDMQVSLCFIKPVSSKRASCPTKVGESLACGIPVVMTKGVGDCDRLVEKERVGVVVPEFSSRGYQTAVSDLMRLMGEGPALAERCRRVAKEHFDLERGVASYLSFYEALSPMGHRR